MQGALVRRAPRWNDEDGCTYQRRRTLWREPRGMCGSQGPILQRVDGMFAFCACTATPSLPIVACFPFSHQGAPRLAGSSFLGDAVRRIRLSAALAFANKLRGHNSTTVLLGIQAAESRCPSVTVTRLAFADRLHESRYSRRWESLL